ncbi:MAG: S24/S26 family peptidase [Actinomycetota bacterium]
MTGSRIRTALALAALASVWLTLGPRTLGGGVDYVVVTRGTSMQPTLEVGDLVVTRPAGNYEVGDIIAVRGLDGPVVVHRVVSTEGSIRTRGDGNDFVDPDPIAPQQIVGRMALRVPAVGRWMGAFGRGGLMGVIVALLVFLVGLGYLREDRTKSDRSAGETTPKPQHRGNSDPNTLQHAAIGLLVGGVIVAGVGFAAPERQPGPVAVPHQVKVTTGGPAPQGPVYPDGVVPDGQPFYLKLVDQARVKIAVGSTDAAEVIPAAGTWKMTALLGSSAGWERSFPMGEGELSGGVARGRLDLMQLREVLEGFKAQTGDNEGFYPVSIRTALQLHGQTRGVDYTQPMVPELKMRFDGQRLFLDPTTASTGTSTTTEVVVPGASPGTLSLAGRQIPTRALRILAALLMLAGAVTAVLSLVVPVTALVGRRERVRILAGHRR